MRDAFLISVELRAVELRAIALHADRDGGCGVQGGRHSRRHSKGRRQGGGSKSCGAAGNAWQDCRRYRWAWPQWIQAALNWRHACAVQVTPADAGFPNIYYLLSISVQISAIAKYQSHACVTCMSTCSDKVLSAWLGSNMFVQGLTSTQCDCHKQVPTLAWGSRRAWQSPRQAAMSYSPCATLRRARSECSLSHVLPKSVQRLLYLQITQLTLCCATHSNA